MNYSCDRWSCDNLNPDGTCMYGICSELIEWAKSDKPMCEHLRAMILKAIREVDAE